MFQYRAALLLIFFSCLIAEIACTKKEIKMEKYIEEKIVFIGKQSEREYAISYVDSVLRKKGSFNVYGNLSAGLAKISENSKVVIKDNNDSYSISIWPISNSGGHDFSFDIYKETGTISNVVVGEALPEPDE